MAQSEDYKNIKQFLKETMADLGYYGCHMRVDVDPTEFTDGKERYITSINNVELYRGNNYAEVIYQIIAVKKIFTIFMDIPADTLSKILKDRYKRMIIEALEKWPDKTYNYFEPAFEGDTDEDCPTIMAYIDELQLQENVYHLFVMHRIEMDENNNVKLIGRIAGVDHTADEELYTYLDSVYEFDLQYMLVPDYYEFTIGTEEETEIEER